MEGRKREEKKRCMWINTWSINARRGEWKVIIQVTCPTRVCLHPAPHSFTLWKIHPFHPWMILTNPSMDDTHHSIRGWYSPFHSDDSFFHQSIILSSKRCPFAWNYTSTMTHSHMDDNDNNGADCSDDDDDDDDDDDNDVDDVFFIYSRCSRQWMNQWILIRATGPLLLHIQSW